MTTKFLSIQGSHRDIEIALYYDQKEIESIKECNQKASSSILPLIGKILTNNKLSIHDLDFIAIDQGPGAFTSLRVAITTVNAISFASKIPLIGIDGLKALIDIPYKTDFIVGILNAYNRDAYYVIQTKDYMSSYKNIDLLMSELTTKIKENSVTFIGNGTVNYLKEIKTSFPDAVILNQNECSTKQIASMALKKWHSKETKSKLMPKYLKIQNYKSKF